MEDREADAYRGKARVYDALFGRMNAALWGIGMRMLPPEAGMQVLDVGCGTGLQLLGYRDAGCGVSGIDVSASMLDIARRRLGDGARVDLGDATRMPYPDGAFDLVLATTVLHEMSPEVRVAVLGEMRRVVRSDGRILLIDFEPGRARPLRGWVTRCVVAAAETAAGRTHHGNYRDFMARGGLSRLLDDCGWAVDRRRIVSGGTIGVYLAHPVAGLHADRALRTATTPDVVEAGQQSAKE